LFESSEVAQAALDAKCLLAQRLAGTLALALGLDSILGSAVVQNDPWLACSQAEYLILIAPDAGARVEFAYRKALTKADRFTLDAARRNVDIFQRLGQFEPATSRALKVIDSIAVDRPSEPVAPVRVIVFTGHMIDREDRPLNNARFPRTRAAEEQARLMIRQALTAEVKGQVGHVIGLAGGACGGDILFHEVCRELGITTEMYLALPENEYVTASVQSGGADWVERFRILLPACSHHVLQSTRMLPKWLTDKPDYDVWQRCNQWMLASALVSNAPHRTLIALYNSELDPDGPGGTAHLLEGAKGFGFKPILLDARALLTPVS
jgi:hypothetical protein